MFTPRYNAPRVWGDDCTRWDRPNDAALHNSWHFGRPLVTNNFVTNNLDDGDYYVDNHHPRTPRSHVCR